MRHKDDLDQKLDRVLDQIRDNRPEAKLEKQATDRVWQSLSTELGAQERSEAPIRSCDDFQELLGDYLDEKLSAARTMLVRDHLGECVTCRRGLRLAKSERTVTRSSEGTTRSSGSWTWRVAAAAAVFIALIGISFETDVLSFETGGLIRVQEIQGQLFEVTEAGTRPLSVGDQVRLGDGTEVRTGKGSSAVLALTDASEIEMRERSELAVHEKRSFIPGRKTDGVIDLDRGSIIIEASQQGSGHLYVRTDDCRVAVTGTIFSVNHGIKGSRVSVIEGEVHVDHSGTQEVLQIGEQTTTSPGLRAVPVEDEVAWSRNVEEYRAIVRTVRDIGREMDETLRPELRYSTDLLDIVPADTAVFVAAPNLTDGLDQAYSILKQRVSENLMLAMWWQENVVNSGIEEELNTIVTRLRDFGAQVDDEVVLALPVVAGRGETDPVFLAKLTNAENFADLIEQAIEEETESVTLLQGSTLQGARRVGDLVSRGLYVWVRDSMLIASSSLDQLDRYDVDAPGLTGDFHAELSDRYREGVEWLVGVDIARLLTTNDGSGDDAIERFGLDDMQHLIAERKSNGDRIENRAVLRFAGERRSVASWIAEPAPMGSLNYISPDAHFATAIVAQDMSIIVDEILELFADQSTDVEAALQEFENEYGLDIRADFADLLGGEFAMALDGPVLPFPQWEAIFESYDDAGLQRSLEQVVEQVNRVSESSTPILRMADGAAEGQYRIDIVPTGLSVHYGFDEGYLIFASSSASLQKTFQNRASGINFATSPRFTDALPPDSEVHFSAMAYQNIGSLLNPLSGLLGGAIPEFSPEQAQLLTAVTEESEPSVLVAFAGDDHISVASSSRDGLFRTVLSHVLGAEGLRALDR